MISQITPARPSAAQPREVDGALGLTAADEHATLARTEGEHVSGPVRVQGLGLGVGGHEIVRARSAALMPVVTPEAASIETVKAVRWLLVL